jgi:hypothetical protein
LAAATAAIITARWTGSGTKAASNGNGHGHPAGNGHGIDGPAAHSLSPFDGDSAVPAGEPHAETSGWQEHHWRSGTGHGYPEQPGTDHGYAEQFGTDHGYAEQFGTDHGYAEQFGADRGYPEQHGAVGHAVAEGWADAFGPSGDSPSNGHDSPTSGFSAWAPPASTELPGPGLPDAAADPGPALVHGQGSGFGEAAASFFAVVAPEPVPEIFDPFIPAQRGTDPGPAVGEQGRDPGSPAPDHTLGQQDVRTQVPPGFERRNFGPFPDEPAPPAPNSGPDRPRGFETVAPAALLGSLPPVPGPMPASFAPPEPAPWTDPGWVGFGELSPPADQPPGSGRTSGTDQLVGAGSRSAGAGGASLLGSLPRRVPQIPDVPDFPIFDSEAEADPIEEHRNLNRVATFLRDEEGEVSADQPRPDGIDLAAVLDAVRGVPHVRDAQLRWNAHAGHTLRIEFTDGVDQSEVTRSVVRLLRQRLGLAAQPSTEEPTVDSPFRGRVSVGGTGTRPASRAAASPPSALPSRPLARPSSVEAPRLAVENVTVTRLGAEAVVEVRLRMPGGATAVGEGRGPGVDAYLSRLAATAAAHAVDRALAMDGRERGRAFIEHVSVVPFGVVEVAVVVLLLSYDGATEQLSGSAIVGEDPHLAVVRATLAALNRRLESLLG